MQLYLFFTVVEMLGYTSKLHFNFTSIGNGILKQRETYLVTISILDRRLIREGPFAISYGVEILTQGWLYREQCCCPVASLGRPVCSADINPETLRTHTVDRLFTNPRQITVIRMSVCISVKYSISFQLKTNTYFQMTSTTASTSIQRFTHLNTS